LHDEWTTVLLGNGVLALEDLDCERELVIPRQHIVVTQKA
jgi:hypothetical protein